MKHITLTGWNIEIERTTIQKPETDDGPMVDAPGWVLVFHEVVPNTGDTIRFAMGEDAKDYIIRNLSGGIVPAASFPKLDGPVI